MHIGVITYDFNHQKTEYIVTKLNEDSRISSIQILALPFKSRPTRNIFFNHRPNQTLGCHTSELTKLNKVSFKLWDGETKIHNCEIFLIGGAGILDISFACGKPIINCHPGIIPTSRGLDSFKWAIFEGDELGVTLHEIDSEVDKGNILHIEKTPIFKEDTINEVAKRHYELELELTVKFLDYINSSYKSIFIEKPSKMRMNNEKEQEMIKKFNAWKEKILFGEHSESSI